ncbi:hypothetical protein AGMMS49975_23270 [Clostridia bacterium]|nr:hypothetical protein AGMMS49975_23270 [Clostridia bacterium]
MDEISRADKLAYKEGFFKACLAMLNLLRYHSMEFKQQRYNTDSFIILLSAVVADNDCFEGWGEFCDIVTDYNAKGKPTRIELKPNNHEENERRGKP